MTENLHVRVEYEELYNSKKDVLILQASILRGLQNLKKYKESRATELKKKNNLLRNLKSVKSNFTKLKQTLPKVEEPKSSKEEDKELPKLPRNKTKDKEQNKIESELEKIQKKLRQLGG